VRSRRHRRGIAAASALFLGWLLAAPGAARAREAAPLQPQARWPELRCDPIPAEVIPEAALPSARARCDSLRRDLDAVFATGRLPEPPQQSAPRLVAWIAEILSFPQAGEVDMFANSAAPEEWSAADSAGVLPLVAALALHEAGRESQAVAWCERGRTNPADDPYRALLAIELHDALGDSAGATDAAERIVARAPHDPFFHPAAARILDEHAKDPADLLRESLRIRRSLGPCAEDVAARYRALIALSRPAAGAAVGDTLLRSYGSTRSARDEAIRRFRGLGKMLPRAERNSVFDVLMRHRLFVQADSLLSGVSGADSLRVVRLEGLLAARQYDGIFADRTAPSRLWSRDLLARWHLVRGRAARNSGRIALMEREYAAAAALGGETRAIALTEWAREVESDVRDRQADSLYTLLLRIPHTADEARFRRGIARFASRRLGNAEADFRLLRKTSFSNAAAFWRFKVAVSRGDSASARAALREAAAGMGGYYARRAQMEIARRAAGMKRGDFWAAERRDLFVVGPRDAARPFAAADGGNRIRCDVGGWLDARAHRVRLLRRFGRAEWAEREQDILESETPIGRRAECFFCLGLPDLAVRVAVGRGSDASESFRYPRPFASWVEGWAHRISPELLYAIARRESLFDPGAVSTAGARGLLQLMDETAIETARKCGIPPGPLERADRNLALGTNCLLDLSESHDWPVPALVAAYNAGEAKTAEWVARFPDPDLFVERIGWRETRDYVRNVLEACWIYRNLAAGGTDGR